MDKPTIKFVQTTPVTSDVFTNLRIVGGLECASPAFRKIGGIRWDRHTVPCFMPASEFMLLSLTELKMIHDELETQVAARKPAQGE